MLHGIKTKKTTSAYENQKILKVIRKKKIQYTDAPGLTVRSHL